MRPLCLQEVLQSAAVLVDVESVEQSSSAVANDLMPRYRSRHAMKEKHMPSHCMLAKYIIRLYIGYVMFA